MGISRNRLYLILLLLSVAGYAWLAVSAGRGAHAGRVPELCIFRSVTGSPCPSCGTTRSVQLLAGGDLPAALKLNPLGFPAGLALLVLPFWLLGDVLLGRSSLHRFYLAAEKLLRYPPVWIALLLLLLANWIWNIYKGL